MLLLPQKKKDNGFTQNLSERLADSDSLVRTGFIVLKHGQNMPVSKSKANILFCNNGEKKRIFMKIKSAVLCYRKEAYLHQRILVRNGFETPKITPKLELGQCLRTWSIISAHWHVWLDPSF